MGNKYFRSSYSNCMHLVMVSWYLNSNSELQLQLQRPATIDDDNVNRQQRWPTHDKKDKKKK